MMMIMKYFWRLYYLIFPVKGNKLSDFLKSTARRQGIRLVEHKLVHKPRPVDFTGLAWVNKPEDNAWLDVDNLPEALVRRLSLVGKLYGNSRKGEEK